MCTRMYVAGARHACVNARGRRVVSFTTGMLYQRGNCGGPSRDVCGCAIGVSDARGRERPAAHT